MAFEAKRKFKRSVQREAVRILTASGLEYATFEDLSAGGLKLWLDHEVPSGLMMELEFSLRASSGDLISNLKVLGRVVRCIKQSSGFEVGIHFVDLPQAARRSLSMALSGDPDSDVDGSFN